MWSSSHMARKAVSKAPIPCAPPTPTHRGRSLRPLHPQPAASHRQAHSLLRSSRHVLHRTLFSQSFLWLPPALFGPPQRLPVPVASRPGRRGAQAALRRGGAGVAAGAQQMLGKHTEPRRRRRETETEREEAGKKTDAPPPPPRGSALLAPGRCVISCSNLHASALSRFSTVNISVGVQKKP